MSSVSTDLKKITWFLTHAVENIYPSREALCERLSSGKPLRIYNGIDPTGPTLHVGHSIPLRKLAELQELGHKVILLIGDFTAMIGDPTDKTATRKKLTREEVLANCKLYKEQATHFLKFDGSNPAEFRFNSEWLAKMSFADVVELASHFTVQQMMERDMFEKRMEEGKPIYLHEFMYPLMQGYDSVAMVVDIEIGGNDQTFNMLAGRTLMKEMKGKEKFVLTLRLLSDTTGKKMGKSEGNMLSLLDLPEDMYGKVMSWTDEMIVPGFEICTQKTEEEIIEVKTSLEEGANPMQWKRFLAYQIVEGLRGEDAAKQAAEQFTRVHSQGEIPEDVPEIRITHHASLIDILIQAGLVESKTDARRQIEQGGVRVDDQVATDGKIMIEPTKEWVLIKKGKRFFVKIIKG